MEKYQEETKRKDQKFLEIKATRDAMHARMQRSTTKIEADIENAKMLLEFIEVDEMKLQFKRTTRAKVPEPPVKKGVSIKDIFAVRSQAPTSSNDDESRRAMSWPGDTAPLHWATLACATSQVPFISGGDEQPYLSSLQVPIAEVEALWAKFDAQEEAHIAELVQIKHQTVVDTVQRSIGVPFSDSELEKLVDGLWPPLAEQKLLALFIYVLLSRSSKFHQHTAVERCLF
ncbi:hypothetical protein HBI56_049160 [Parastagonospora nodorum]|uniref:Uncharacterized protein n=1 Tax=Phaeosphaeria nodorum (strain SN15 / ATCC MYA-4574 / FGSC 10173) TaxID=321614 RepID=A0A7U2HU74_PHANO|nr:hypothetical protein HBH56_062070 [Parastagonospora nodorum]QRC92025.1 hypothetical protein JI435_021940 [Parastagonospora nodorum SN15]KAH3931131.1 hypothetical protein HBH54_106020 [Parastagonospora nodorum]KAH3977586.1 hypothetical protein HBH52_115120 [Parastagonospora nodorum]KAH4140500.1 hypothetical protein HBH45_075680 [Parastagonospora nodorum]